MKIRFLSAVCALTLSLSAFSEDFSREVTFDSGVVGAKAETVDTFDGVAGRTTFSTAFPRPLVDGADPQHVMMTIKEGETGWGVWGGAMNFRKNLYKGDIFWASFHMYVPDDFQFYAAGNGALKFLRIRTRASAADGVGGFNDFQIMDDPSFNGAVYRFIKEGAAGRGWKYIGTKDQKDELLPRNKWFKVEISLRFDSVPVSEGGLAYFKLWIDNKLVWDGKDVQTLTSSGDWADSLYFFTYWNGKAPKTQSLYIDNIVMKSSVDTAELRPQDRDAEGNLYIGEKGNPSALYKSPPSRVEATIQ
ncbi:hypothetical protein O5O45_13110 [Hahella aquimaris]|uniref:hypothetical protein n=1 Tax=Hahella sp. HNIBRBA332 TaxID=3015983 RepID=UPI00273A9270|nr:hypothetical protein [Hahella sp. HNIBRBA332]WLQ16855.1 hypothetical protein O5O45_13110 [Hahella sp. HNIBRBA332]